MIGLSIITEDHGEETSSFSSLIKPFPALSESEKVRLQADLNLLRKAPPLCDITPEIAEILNNCETVFLDKFSERLFISSFREIGFPVGRGTYFIDQLFKRHIDSKGDFQLKSAMEYFQISQKLETNYDNCKAIFQIFSKLRTEEDLKLIPKERTRETVISKFSSEVFPKKPGVYFFRNEEGQIIYVGKAKNISTRVKSHLSSDLPFERELCAETFSIDYEKTGSETIALLLESHYITSLQPQYNSQQKEILNPYTIVSKEDSKGILRIQAIEKSYSDSENEFYYNRQSALLKILEVQRKFNLCRRFTGIEKTAGKCSDRIFCKGICQGKEKRKSYNKRVKLALEYLYEQRPSFIIKLRGRTIHESGLILVKHGIYHGFGYIDNDTIINSIADIESYIKPYQHNYFTSRIIDQHLRTNKKEENFIPLEVI